MVDVKGSAAATAATADVKASDRMSKMMGRRWTSRGGGKTYIECCSTAGAGAHCHCCCCCCFHAIDRSIDRQYASSSSSSLVDVV